MWFQKYLNTINKISPDKIYVENVRAITKTPRLFAKFLCEALVVDNVFKKKVGIVCPSCQKMILSANFDSDLPKEVQCDICELEDKEEFLFKIERCQIIEFYQLVKSSNG